MKMFPRKNNFLSTQYFTIRAERHGQVSKLSNWLAVILRNLDKKTLIFDEFLLFIKSCKG